MKLNEIIELNDKEYTVELNRESILRIEQYINMQKSMEILSYNPIEDKSEKEIDENENPFEKEINDEEIEKLYKLKEQTLHNVYTRAFWIWLYPVEKLSYKQVEEILRPNLEDDEKAKYISEKYEEFSNKSVEIRREYLEEQKNLKALTK